MDFGVTGNYKDDELVEPRIVECTTYLCTKTVVVDMAAVEACYGWDGGTNTWYSLPPNEVQEACIPGFEPCEMAVISQPDVE